MVVVFTVRGWLRIDSLRKRLLASLGEHLTLVWRLWLVNLSLDFIVILIESLLDHLFVKLHFHHALKFFDLSVVTLH